MLPPPAATAATSGREGLAVTTLAPQLHHGFVQEAVTVQPASGQLTALGVEG